MKFSKIAEILKEPFHGNDVDIKTIGSLDTDYSDAILYVENSKYLEKAKLKKPVALVVPKNLDPGDIPYIKVDDPKLAFIKLLKIFNSRRVDSFGIDTKAIIQNGANIGTNVIVMAGAVIMQDAIIKDNCVVYPNCVVEKKAQIENGTVLYSGAIIREQCVVGSNCIIHAGAIIGADGFGYYEKEGEIIKIPQIGIVKIGDNVEIGANCTIDRATIGKTEIGNYSKLDNLVHIAHNVTIGERCYIAAQTGISGSVDVGNHVVIMGQVGIGDHVTIADDTIIMAQSGIPNNIKKADVFFGTPARQVKEHHRIFASLKYLPELVKRVKGLEQKIKGDKIDS